MVAFRSNWFIPISVAFVIVLVGIAAAITHPLASIQSEGVVRDVATAFVASEKNVRHSMPGVALKQAIDTNFGPFVASTLLQQWHDDPALAPGGTGFVDVPDHIAISTVVPQGAGYIVAGSIVYSNNKTTTTAAHTRPVIIFFVKESGTWKIAAYQEQVGDSALVI